MDEIRSVCCFHNDQFSSVQSLDRFGRRGDMRDDSADILFHFFFKAGGFCEQFWHEQGCSLFPLPTTALPILQAALEDGFGKAVVACDMPGQCKFSSLDSCRKRFLWTDKGVDLAPRPVVGLVL